MKVNKIDHISIAVRDLASARHVWEPIIVNGVLLEIIDYRWNELESR